MNKNVILKDFTGDARTVTGILNDHLYDTSPDMWHMSAFEYGSDGTLSEGIIFAGIHIWDSENGYDDVLWSAIIDDIYPKEWYDDDNFNEEQFLDDLIGTGTPNTRLIMTLVCAHIANIIKITNKF
jgi:hypothetical protein